jgi:hypothetical protein
MRARDLAAPFPTVDLNTSALAAARLLAGQNLPGLIVVVSKIRGQAPSSRAALICLTAGAGPATAIGTSCTDERAEGQAKAVRSMLTATVSRATARATADQGDGDASVAGWA